jgi:very-short-patch-repair endonuclease
VNEHVRHLRKNQTEAEKLLWSRLRNRQMEGFKFRRQWPIGSYIVDFVCLSCKLIIELDGGQHAETIGYDAVRTDFLKSRGYRVIRFWNNEMLVNREAVLERIYEALSKGEEAPSPRPSPRGERE